MYAKSFLALDSNGRLTGARTVPCRLAAEEYDYVRKILYRS